MLKGGQCKDMILLISIHFHTNQNPLIAELVRSTLGFAATIRILDDFLLLD